MNEYLITIDEPDATNTKKGGGKKVANITPTTPEKPSEQKEATTTPSKEAFMRVYFNHVQDKYIPNIKKQNAVSIKSRSGFDASIDTSGVLPGWYWAIFCVSLKDMPVGVLDNLIFDVRSDDTMEDNDEKATDIEEMKATGKKEANTKDITGTGTRDKMGADTRDKKKTDTTNDKDHTCRTVVLKDEIVRIPITGSARLRLHRQVKVISKSKMTVSININTVSGYKEDASFDLHCFELACSDPKSQDYVLWGEGRPDQFLSIGANDAGCEKRPVAIDAYGISDNGKLAVTVYFTDESAIPKSRTAASTADHTSIPASFSVLGAIARPTAPVIPTGLAAGAGAVVDTDSDVPALAARPDPTGVLSAPTAFTAPITPAAPATPAAGADLVVSMPAAPAPNAPGEPAAPAPGAPGEPAAPAPGAPGDPDAPAPNAPGDPAASTPNAPGHPDAPAPNAPGDPDASTPNAPGDPDAPAPGALGDPDAPTPGASGDPDAPTPGASGDPDAPAPGASDNPDAPAPGASGLPDASAPVAPGLLAAPAPGASGDPDAPTPGVSGLLAAPAPGAPGKYAAADAGAHGRVIYALNALAAALADLVAPAVASGASADNPQSNPVEPQKHSMQSQGHPTSPRHYQTIDKPCKHIQHYFGFGSFHNSDQDDPKPENERYFNIHGSRLDVYSTNGSWKQLYSLSFEINNTPLRPNDMLYLRQSLRGRYFAWTGDVGAVSVWDFETGKSVTTILIPKDAEGVGAALSEDGSMIAISAMGSVRVHDVVSGVELGLRKAEWEKGTGLEMIFKQDCLMALDAARSTPGGGHIDARSTFRARDLTIVDTRIVYWQYRLKFSSTSDLVFAYRQVKEIKDDSDDDDDDDGAAKDDLDEKELKDVSYDKEAKVDPGDKKVEQDINSNKPPTLTLTFPSTADDTFLTTEKYRYENGIASLTGTYASSDFDVKMAVIRFLVSHIPPSVDQPISSLVALCRSWKHSSRMIFEHIITDLLPTTRVTWIPDFNAKKDDDPLSILMETAKTNPSVLGACNIVIDYQVRHAVKTHDLSFLSPFFRNLKNIVDLIPGEAREYLNQTATISVDDSWRDYIIENSIVAHSPWQYIQFWKAPLGLDKVKDPVMQLHVATERSDGTRWREYFIKKLVAFSLWQYRHFKRTTLSLDKIKNLAMQLERRHTRADTFTRPIYAAAFDALWHFKNVGECEAEGSEDATIKLSSMVRHASTTLNGLTLEQKPMEMVLRMEGKKIKKETTKKQKSAAKQVATTGQDDIGDQRATETTWWKTLYHMFRLKFHLKIHNYVTCHEFSLEFFDNPAIAALVEYK
ncbi:hypothetical protein BGZ72_005193, partial [Mortierella alpina]